MRVHTIIIRHEQNPSTQLSPQIDSPAAFEHLSPLGARYPCTNVAPRRSVDKFQKLIHATIAHGRLQVPLKGKILEVLVSFPASSLHQTLYVVRIRCLISIHCHLCLDFRSVRIVVASHCNATCIVTGH